MDDKYFRESPSTTLTFWVMGQMMKGAGLALLFCLALLACWILLRLIGWGLPEQSKQMPSPYVQIEAPLSASATDLA
jgi:hypothetical protein